MSWNICFFGQMMRSFNLFYMETRQYFLLTSGDAPFIYYRFSSFLFCWDLLPQDWPDLFFLSHPCKCFSLSSTTTWPIVAGRKYWAQRAATLSAYWLYQVALRVRICQWILSLHICAIFNRSTLTLVILHSFRFSLSRRLELCCLPCLRLEGRQKLGDWFWLCVSAILLMWSWRLLTEPWFLWACSDILVYNDKLRKVTKCSVKSGGTWSFDPAGDDYLLSDTTAWNCIICRPGSSS